MTDRPRPQSNQDLQSPHDAFRQRILSKTPDQLRLSITARQNLLDKPTTDAKARSRVTIELDFLKQRDQLLQEDELERVRVQLRAEGLLTLPQNAENAFRQRVKQKATEDLNASIQGREAVLKKASSSPQDKARAQEELAMLHDEEQQRFATRIQAKTIDELNSSIASRETQLRKATTSLQNQKIQRELAALQKAKEISKPEKPKNLLDQINQTLSKAPGSVALVETPPSAIVEYFKSIKLPPGASIDRIDEPLIKNGMLSTKGKINTPLGAVTFEITLRNSQAGGVVLDDKPKLSVPIALKLAGKEAEIITKLTNINQEIATQLDKKIDPAWQSNGLQISGDKITFNFKKK